MSLLLLSALLAGCQAGSAPAASPPEGQSSPLPQLFRATAPGVAPALELRELAWVGGQPVVRLAGATEGRAVPDWLSLVWPGPSLGRQPSPAAVSSGWRLQLNGGGELRGEPTVTADGAPGFRLSGVVAEVFPLDSLWLLALGREALPQADGDQDQLWVRTVTGSRDVRRGYFLDWSATGVTFEGVNGEQEIPWAEVEGFGLLEEKMEAQLNGPLVWVELRQGSAFRAQVLTFEEGKLHLRLPWGEAWQVPIEALARIRRIDGLESLNAKAWALAQEPKTAAMDWRPKRNRSVEGGRLQVAGRPFQEGLGVHAPTIVQQTMTAPGVLFLAVGVDDQVATFHRPQPLRFEVWLDQEPLAVVARQVVGEPATTLVVSLPHAGELSLKTVGADGLDFGGHGDWLDLAFLPAAGEQP